jgi:hypothetical protein
MEEAVTDGVPVRRLSRPLQEKTSLFSNCKSSLRSPPRMTFRGSYTGPIVFFINVHAPASKRQTGG